MELRKIVPVLAMCVFFVGSAAAEGVNVDAMFDKTGDGIVDGEDWQLMSDEEKEAYARRSVMGLGQDPDDVVEDGKTRALLYLEGLRSVYD